MRNGRSGSGEGVILSISQKTVELPGVCDLTLERGLSIESVSHRAVVYCGAVSCGLGCFESPVTVGLLIAAAQGELRLR